MTKSDRETERVSAGRSTHTRGWWATFKGDGYREHRSSQAGGIHASIHACKLHSPTQVIEIGQVGALQSPPGAAGAPMRLYAHAQRGTGFGDAAPVVAALRAASGGEAAAANVDVRAASASTPGVPPSSLMSFLRINASIQGVVLTEFDREFNNPYYGSRFDNGSALRPEGMAAAAAVLAGALHRLAGGDPLQLQVCRVHHRAV